MKHFALVFMVFAVALLIGCSKEHQDLPTGFAFDPPPAPTNFEVVGGPFEVELTWDYPAEEMGALEEFRIYYYYESYGMLELIGTTSNTTYTDSQLVGNVVYCYQVSAVDTTGLEGYRTDAACAITVTSSR